MIYLILIVAGIGVLILPTSRIIVDYVQRHHPEKISDRRKQLYRIISIIISFTLLSIALWMTNLLRVE